MEKKKINMRRKVESRGRINKGGKPKRKTEENRSQGSKKESKKGRKEGRNNGGKK